MMKSFQLKMTSSRFKRSQGMVEFALVLPILLLVVFGLLEVGRGLFVYSTVVSASREAMRYGSASGLLVGGSIQYTDCTGIRAAAQKVNFLGSFADSDVVISYDHGTPGTTFAYCPPGSPDISSVEVQSGDRIVVTVTGTFDPLAGIVPLSQLHFTSTSARTILADVSINAPTPPPGTSKVLSFIKGGIGSGSVTIDPGGFTCSSACSNAFPNGTVVTLTATAAGGSSFAGWSGAGCTGTGTCMVTMGSDKVVTANFNLLTPTLYVTKTGTGTGTVTSDTGDIDCGSTCSHTFAKNTSVILMVDADLGSSFAGWVGACTGTGACVVTMDIAKSVTAIFDSTATKTLSYYKMGTGSGKVGSDPAGLYCSGSCYYSFNTGTVVTLTAVANTGSTFLGWDGSGCTGTSTCTVTMDAARTVTAYFDSNTYELLVTHTGAGTGTVTVYPNGVSCGPECYVYTKSTVVTLTATADTTNGSTFTGWMGNGCSGTGTCTVTMDSNKEEYATFDSPASKTLIVTKTGNGTGTITSGLGAINCGLFCSYYYPNGQVVTLTAVADSGSNFGGWTGGGCSGTGTCTVTMTTAVSVNANFTSTQCAFTSEKPTLTGSSQSIITWHFNNTTPDGSTIPINYMLVVWDHGNLRSIVLDTTTWWNGNQGPIAGFRVYGGSVSPGAHTLTFTYEAPKLQGNFSATLYFVPNSCPTLNGSYP